MLGAEILLPGVRFAPGFHQAGLLILAQRAAEGTRGERPQDLAHTAWGSLSCGDSMKMLRCVGGGHWV